MKKNFIIYHDKCTDGLTSASIFKYWIEKNDYQNKNRYHFIGGHFQMTKEDIEILKESTVFFLDFSFKKELFENVLEIADNVILIDHHKGAYDELNHLFENSKLKVVFDLNECGSSLTWKYLFPQRPLPIIIEYVKDRDIWIWLHKESKAYLASLDTLEFTLEAFEKFYINLLLNSDVEKYNTIIQNMIETGKTLLIQKDNMVKVILDNVRYIDYLDYKNIAVCNCNFLFTNDVSEKLLRSRINESRALITYQDSIKGRKFSIRTEEEIDAIALAKSIDKNGGGHPKASGAFIAYEDLYTHPLTLALYL